MKLCTVCNKPLIGKQIKYCSNRCKCKISNSEHQTYAHQKARGIKRKKELVEMLGGKCSFCNYNKNYAALSFHHLRDKDFKLDQRGLSNYKWERILREVKKCVLLCMNCHMQVHYPDLNIEH